MKSDTICIHAGTCRDTFTGGINSPIFPSTADDIIRDLERGFGQTGTDN